MSGLRRRDWFRVMGSGGAALVLGCSDDAGATTREIAVALLEPGTDTLSVAIWARHGHEAIVEVRAGRHVSRTAQSISRSRSAVVELQGLAAGTEHEITVLMNGFRLGPYRAQTAPADDDPRPVRIAVAADAEPTHRYDTDLASQLVDTAPDLLVTIGDYPYTDNGPAARTHFDYRRRYAEFRTLPNIRALHEAMAVRAIYDDHEFGNDWDADLAAADPGRLVTAMTVWDEFFPVRGATGDVRYRSWRWGAHAECFLLDCRRFRSANHAPDGPEKTMLGAQQLAWLLDALAQSTATFKLVFTSVPLDFGVGVDHWAAFTYERQVIFNALVGIPGVLFLSGDQHWFASHRHAFGIREFQIGPLARGFGVPGPLAPGVMFRAVQYNVGVIEIDGDQLAFYALGPGGARLYEETLTAEALTPSR